MGNAWQKTAARGVRFPRRRIKDRDVGQMDFHRSTGQDIGRYVFAGSALEFGWAWIKPNCGTRMGLFYILLGEKTSAGANEAMTLVF
jgi:hypothetical protein